LARFGHTLGALSGAASNDVLISRKARTAGSPEPHLAALRGKRLVWASETAEGERLNAAQIKQLTGGGTITARQLYARVAVEFSPTHLLILMTNYRPHAPADDEAVWSRLSLIPFTRRFVDNPTKPHEFHADKHIGDKLKAESPGILAWLVRGCLEWQRVGGLNPPECVKAATGEYRADEDTVGQFVEERCQVGEKFGVGATELYQSYRRWCQDMGLSADVGHRIRAEAGQAFRWQPHGHWQAVCGPPRAA
jgi:putative DNA primase/helicase